VARYQFDREATNRQGSDGEPGVLEPLDNVKSVKPYVVRLIEDRTSFVWCGDRPVWKSGRRSITVNTDASRQLVVWLNNYGQ